MKKCIAFSAIPGSQEVWIPCARRAENGYALCPRHSNMVAGVMLGLCTLQFPDASEKAIAISRRQRVARNQNEQAGR